MELCDLAKVKLLNCKLNYLTTPKQQRKRFQDMVHLPLPPSMFLSFVNSDNPTTPLKALAEKQNYQMKLTEFALR